MPVYKDSKRGTWYISHQVKDPVTGKSKTTKKRGYKTKRDAILAEKELFLNPQSGSITVRELIPLWEAYYHCSKETKLRHGEHFRYRFPELLDMPVERLDKPFLSRLRAKLAEDDRFSTKTKNIAISYLKSLLRFGHNFYNLPDNSAVMLKLKKTDEEVIEDSLKELDVWTVEEFNQFIECVHLPIYQAFFRFLYWTGCRRGEAIALQKRDAHDHEVTFRYSQRLQKDGLKPTKGRNVRTIGIDDYTWECIQSLPENGSSYVFGGERGLAPNPITKQFKKAIEKSGVKPIRIHDLRHSHASWLINNGVNIVAVSRRLGHKDVSTTLNTYTHLLESTDNDMMNKLNHATVMPQKEKSL